MSSEANESQASPNRIVLDTSAAMAFCSTRREARPSCPTSQPGTSPPSIRLRPFPSACGRGGTFADVWNMLAFLPLTARDFTHEQARAAASLQPFAQSHNLSLGDRCCLALAISLGAPVLTADRKLATLPLPVEVRLVRP